MYRQKIVFALLFAGSLCSFQSLSAQAQNESTDGLPGRPTAEKFVKEAPAAVAVTAPAATPAANAAESAVGGESIVRTALQYLGARYRSGHSGPTAFDCSGFTSYVYGQESVPISRSSRTQFLEGSPVTSIAELQKGDRVFYGGSAAARRVGHVGIVTDVDSEGKSFKFVHASRTGVKVDNSTSAYYSRRYIGARRILNNR